VPIYLLCFLTVSSLGYFGGQIVYGGNTPIGTTQFQSGQKLFENHCSGCHAHGGNSIMSNFPLRDAPELDKFEDFLTFIRGPTLPGGVDGPMPPFAQSTISAEEARELYDYITQVMDKPQRK
jgi:mono/diheme cytochrome c family protein